MEQRLRVAILRTPPTACNRVDRLLPESLFNLVADVVGDNENALLQLELAQPDVVIVDARGGADVTALGWAMRRRLPTVRVLVIGVIGDEISPRRALTSGVHGYLTRDTSPGAIASAVLELGRQGIWLTGGARRAMHDLIALGTPAIERIERIELKAESLGDA
jgi:DNA-binding NarL/FixJ family response regulator